MKNIDIKKVIIILILPIMVGIVGYFVLSSFFNEDKTPSTDELGIFLPFNEESEGVNEEGDYLTTTTQSSSGIPSIDSIPILRQITNTPMAGAIIFPPKADEQESEQKSYIIRYIEKTTGHIYETTTNSLSQSRISNTTIPQIQESLWLDDESLIIRYLDDNTIKTFSAELVIDEFGDQKLEGIFLQDDVREIIKFGKKIFYLLDGGKGLVGVVADKNDGNRKIIFESPLTEWLLTNVDNKYINFTTKPAINTIGFSFLFNTETDSFNKIIGDKSNLSTLIDKSFNVLYSVYDKLGPKLYIYDNEDKINTEIYIQTFPEKCVWDEEGIYIYCGVPTEELSNYDLTKWYKGLTSFSDDIWRINTKTNTIEFLISPKESGVGDIDIINPILNEDGNYLLFTNKKDYSLWGLRLKKEL